MMMVVAVIISKPGMEKQVRQLLDTLVAPSMAESGCLDIHLNEAIDKSGTFAFITRWRTEGDFDRHLSTPYVKAFLDKVPSLLSTPPAVQRWTIIAPASKNSRDPG